MSFAITNPLQGVILALERQGFIQPFVKAANT